MLIHPTELHVVAFCEEKPLVSFPVEVYFSLMLDGSIGLLAGIQVC